MVMWKLVYTKQSQ